VWFWRARHPERKGERCRVWARGTMNSIGVEFPDGFRTVTARYAIRKAPAEDLEVHIERPRRPVFVRSASLEHGAERARKAVVAGASPSSALGRNRTGI
jgi:hypothetical protein